MSAVERDRAVPGELVGADTCGRQLEDGTYCGQPIAYEVRFRGWPADCLAGVCVDHVADARELDVERIWSVAP